MSESKYPKCPKCETGVLKSPVNCENHKLCCTFCSYGVPLQTVEKEGIS